MTPVRRLCPSLIFISPTKVSTQELSACEHSRDGHAQSVVSNVGNLLFSLWLEGQQTEEQGTVVAAKVSTPRWTTLRHCLPDTGRSAVEGGQEATVLFIVGISSLDWWHGAMLEGLRRLAVGDIASLFFPNIRAEPSTHLWEGEEGEAHETHKCEGDEQGDAVMPLLFVLGEWRCRSRSVSFSGGDVSLLTSVGCAP